MKGDNRFLIHSSNKQVFLTHFLQFTVYQGNRGLFFDFSAQNTATHPSYKSEILLFPKHTWAVQTGHVFQDGGDVFPFPYGHLVREQFWFVLPCATFIRQQSWCPQPSHVSVRETKGMILPRSTANFWHRFLKNFLRPNECYLIKRLSDNHDVLKVDSYSSGRRGAGGGGYCLCFCRLRLWNRL